VGRTPIYRGVRRTADLLFSLIAKPRSLQAARHGGQTAHVCATREVVRFGSRDPPAFWRIPGFCVRQGKARDPKERDHGYQNLCDSILMGLGWVAHTPIYRGVRRTADLLFSLIAKPRSLQAARHGGQTAHVCATRPQ
jgi:hypothetical protein